MAKKKRKVLLGSFLFFLAAGGASYLFRRPILAWIGTYLVVSDPLGKADAIEILSGAALQRARKAAELYHEGWAPRILITKMEHAPVVEELKMEYHQFGSHRDPTLDWGFDVVIRLADREHTVGYLSMFFFASGLDANQPLGRAETPPGFVSKDTIELAYSNGSESWRMTWGTDARRLRRQDYQEPGYGYQIYADAPKARGGGDLAALPEDLTALTVKGSAFSGENGPALLRFQKLRSLWWEVDPKSLAGVAFYSELPSLERLDLECTDVDDELILRISRMKRLTRLFIRHADRVTDEGWARLAALENLTYLGAWHGNRLTDKALESLAGLKKLESLHFARCPGFKDAGLAAVSRLSSLRSLSFSGVDGFTPEGLKHLEKLSLEDLDFTFLPLGDEGFRSVGRIATLRELSLRYLDNLTDAGLAHLKGLKRMKELHIHRCPGVTTKGLKDLQAAWPGTYELK